MKTIQKTFSIPCSYPLERLGLPEKTLFFDIETTGLSADYATVYLIGVIRPEGGRFLMTQWFADTLSAEEEVLDAFFRYLKDYDTLIHFNGDTFDIPFLTKRAGRLHLTPTFNAVESVDIYKRIRPYKKLLNLENVKQKTVERFLGIDREDLYSGGELIEVYQTYLDSGDENCYHLLTLHNEDDLKGMPAILPILSYPDFIQGAFTLAAPPSLLGSAQALRLACKSETALPAGLENESEFWRFYALENILTMDITLYNGPCKYFYPNPKDYYYLPVEDTAIHKSVAEFVNKAYRQKATAKTCYTKKHGCFLPQKQPLFEPAFFMEYKDKTCFAEYSEDLFRDQELLTKYLHQVFCTVK